MVDDNSTHEDQGYIPTDGTEEDDRAFEGSLQREDGDELDDLNSANGVDPDIEAQTDGMPLGDPEDDLDEDAEDDEEFPHP